MSNEKSTPGLGGGCLLFMALSTEGDVPLRIDVELTIGGQMALKADPVAIVVLIQATFVCLPMRIAA